MDHLNFKFEIDNKNNPSKGKIEIIESTNTIYERPDKILLPDKISETWYN